MGAVKVPAKLMFERISSQIPPGQRVVFVSGNFNILHPGHLRLLRFAKECGDYLIVGVRDSATPGVYVQDELRLDGVKAISWVDLAFLMPEAPELFVAEVQPSVVVKGNEHEQQENPETAALASYGGKLVFGSGDISFSSVDLMRKELRELNRSTIRKPLDFLERHSIKSGSALKILEEMRNLRVCVLGDTIVDEYITCDPLGMSQEDPTIVVTPIMTERFLGGAGIVAAHARSLGASVDFFSVLGCDEAAEFTRQTCARWGVNLQSHEDKSRPTTLKQRFRALQKTLLRVSHLRQHDVSTEIRQRILTRIRASLDRIDLLIFSDFNYGCLPQALVTEVVKECRQRRIMMVADSQSSSQVGDISRFLNMQLITPTEREARLAVHDFDSGLVVLAEKLMRKSKAQNVVLTMGAEGLMIHTGLVEPNPWPTDRMLALNEAPKDVAGAGDSFLTCASMALAVGADIWHACYLGSVAAACQVGRLGNIPLSHQEIAEAVVGR